MIYFCALCRKQKRFSELEASLCEPCGWQIEAAKCRRSLRAGLEVASITHPVHSGIFYIVGAVRKLILNAKAGRERTSALSCTQLLNHYVNLASLMVGIDTIVPAPSSFRSRLMGKID